MWEEEFEKYKQYPEYMQKPIEMSHFQIIYLYEWGHRILGRLSGMMYFVPYCYFLKRGSLPRQYLPLFHLTLCGFGLQGLLGWYMVKSGLNFELLKEEKAATVSSYRLTAHLSLALALYSSMMYCAFRLSPANMAAPRKRFTKALCTLAIGCLSTSIVTGAAVAGLDAGMIYNDFPWMGEGIFPPASELASLKPHWRNLFENPSAAQAVHKICACGTFGSVILLGVGLRKTQLAGFRHRLYLLTFGQVGLGIATLMSNVNIYLGVAHQGTAMALLTSLLYILAAA
ncbi:COX15/CtaA family [Perkinsela sp. CCAP 1560/4]|nr:COX15/CtaA family [Perkinsela sp. CCAP 1560/4]|eukprot:KNH07771.1 COX15/CtaA family [Perkinsela sp. CCAP 1560/4]